MAMGLADLLSGPFLGVVAERYPGLRLGLLPPGLFPPASKEDMQRFNDEGPDVAEDEDEEDH